MADDAVNYGEGDMGDADLQPQSFQPDSTNAFGNEEMAANEEYEDLYDDVNIGYFQAASEFAKQTGNGLGLGYEQEEGYNGMEGQVTAACTIDRPNKVMECKGAFTTASWPGQVIDQSCRQLEKGSPPVTPINRKDATQAVQGDHVAKEEISGDINGLRVLGEQSIDDDIDGFRVLGEQPMAPAEVDESVLTGARERHETDLGFMPALAPAENFESDQDVKPTATLNFQERGGVTDPVYKSEIMYDKAKGAATAPPRHSQSLTRRDASPNITPDKAPRHPVQHTYPSDGGTMLFVGDLHWWTTDTELEAALTEYGRVKNMKFAEERVSGKSKGYCQVEFFDHSAAVACKQGMNGKRFHDRPCIVALGNIKSIQQMGHQQDRKAQAQIHVHQTQSASRRAHNDTGVRGGSSYQDQDSHRGYGRSGTSRTGHGQGMGTKVGQTGSGRGRNNDMRKGMADAGNTGVASAPYGQGHSGHIGSHQSAMMMHQGMLGQGYGPGYGPPMGRGGANYGSYVIPGPSFSGIVQPFPSMGPGALPGVAPHVNPAFFGRSTPASSMGLMSGGGLESSHQGMWAEAALNGWGGEGHDRRVRDGTHNEDMGSVDYNYGTEIGSEKARGTGGREKDIGDWVERRWRGDRDVEREREHYRERDRDSYREQRERGRESDDWERDRLARTRNKARMVEEEKEDYYTMRSREEYYGKRRHTMVERYI